MKKFKFNLQWKLTLSFMAAVILAIIIVSFSAKYYIHRYFQEFCEASGNIIPRCLRGEAGQGFLISINRSLAWVGGLGTIISIMFGYFLSKLILSPLQKVMLATKKFSAGVYTTRITAKTGDEINDLIKTLNEMFSSLEKLEKLRKNLVANLSHELSTPLANIYGYLEALNDGVIKDELERHRAISLVKNEAERLIHLTRELKKLAILESDNFSLLLEEVEINGLMEKICEKFEPRFKEKRIGLKKMFNRGLPKIKIDPAKFEQVISNLLDNAIKYSLYEGIIELKTQQEEKWVIVSVKDYGQGIDQNDLPFIFERFYRADKARTKKDDSVGIGLTIVKKIVEAHKGKIEVKSEKNKGSEFIVYLPKVII